MRRTAILVTALALLSGCGPDYTCVDAPEIRKLEREISNAQTAVEGSWIGRWESLGHPGHGGGLSCVAAKSGGDEWNATFTAEFGRVKAYRVELKGKRDGAQVLFGGSVDLGKDDGGIFNWTGKATATEFTGEYTGGGDRGSFRMTRPK